MSFLGPNNSPYRQADGKESTDKVSSSSSPGYIILAYKFSKFYWPLSGVGIPMEQPTLRRTLSLLQPTGT